MSREPHPFTEEPVAHAGWNVYTFELMGLNWRLTTIAKPDEPARSLLTNDAGSNAPWSRHLITELDGIVSVQACVEFLRRAYFMYDRGRQDGRAATQHAIRQALGIT